MRASSALAPFSLLFLLTACEGSWADRQWSAIEPVIAPLYTADTGTASATDAPAKASSSKLPSLAALIGNAPVGKAVIVATDHDVAEPDSTAAADAPRIAVLEEYDSATGERCRRFAWFEGETKRGKIQTTCKMNDDAEEWIAMRPLAHETMSPLASLPNFGTAALAPTLQPTEQQ